jgi:hypothetical protein
VDFGKQTFLCAVKHIERIDASVAALFSMTKGTDASVAALFSMTSMLKRDLLRSF